MTLVYHQYSDATSNGPGDYGSEFNAATALNLVKSMPVLSTPTMTVMGIRPILKNSGFGLEQSSKPFYFKCRHGVSHPMTVGNFNLNKLNYLINQSNFR